MIKARCFFYTAAVLALPFFSGTVFSGRVDITKEVRELFLRGNITAAALALKGENYVYGGRKPGEGFDCSGFVRYVYASAGINIPRSAAGQYKRSLKLLKAQLKKGDLVFFSTAGAGPSHVGIYTGKGRFIHAPSAGGKVRVDSIDEKYWKIRFMRGGNLIY
ncbi:MAG: C40 family peptidase [Candidatus Goldiibacteriota bacterium]